MNIALIKNINIRLEDRIKHPRLNLQLVRIRSSISSIINNKDFPYLISNNKDKLPLFANNKDKLPLFANNKDQTPLFGNNKDYINEIDIEAI